MRNRVAAIWLATAAAVWSTATAQTGFEPSVIGRIVWPEHDLSAAQVQVYRDPGMKEMVDQFGTGGKKGTFVLILEPGDYYLMAVADANGNQKLDSGDGIGYFGVTEFGAEGQSPRPLKVKGPAVVGDVEIPITATLEPGEEGKLRPAAIEGGASTAATPTGIPATVHGAVAVPEGVDAPVFLVLMNSANRLVADVARIAGTGNEAELKAPAGEYHLIALADVSGDNEIGSGDRFGSVNVADWGDPPEALPTVTLGEGGDEKAVEIPLTGVVDENLVISPEEEPGTFRLDPHLIAPIISGHVAYRGAGLKPVQVRVSSDPGMGNPIAAADCDPGPGTFACAIAPGTYYLTAVVDENADGRFGPGDALGFYGVTDLVSGGAPQSINVRAGSLVHDLEITIVMRVGEGGVPVPLTDAPEE